MGLTALNILWLVAAFTFTTQEMVRLNVSTQITAEYGKPVTLHCKISSKSADKLEVKHMEWSKNQTLCSMNSEGIIITHEKHTPSDFHCDFKNQQLSLVFKTVQPMDIGSYRCKLQSNKGASHAYSNLELEESCVIVEGSSMSQPPVCTFRHVYPDGDVHWFHGSHHLSEHRTMKYVEEGGWLTIVSYLQQDNSDTPYNCSLKSSKSGKFIASTLVPNDEVLVKNARANVLSTVHNSGVRSLITCLYITLLLAVTLK